MIQMRVLIFIIISTLGIFSPAAAEKKLDVSVLPIGLDEYVTKKSDLKYALYYVRKFYQKTEISILGFLSDFGLGPEELVNKYCVDFFSLSDVFPSKDKELFNACKNHEWSPKAGKSPVFTEKILENKINNTVDMFWETRYLKYALAIASKYHPKRIGPKFSFNTNYLKKELEAWRDFALDREGVPPRIHVYKKCNHFFQLPGSDSPAYKEFRKECESWGPPMKDLLPYLHIF